MTSVILSDQDWVLLRQLMADAINAGRGNEDALDDLSRRNQRFTELQRSVLRSASH